MECPVNVGDRVYAKDEVGLDNEKFLHLAFSSVGRNRADLSDLTGVILDCQRAIDYADDYTCWIRCDDGEKNRVYASLLTTTPPMQTVDLDTLSEAFTALMGT